MSKPRKPSPMDRYAELASPVDSWLYSYGDLMTILLVFFVMLMSANKVVKAKAEKEKSAGIEAVHATLDKQVEQAGLKGQVKVETTDTGLQISFHDHLLFDLGKADVKSDGLSVLERFTSTLSTLPKTAQIAIEGYTDDNPVSGGAYQSNWHLSALRSLAVLGVLEGRGVCKENCEIRGFGEHRPTVPNRDDAGRPIAKNQSENRRVVLRVF